MYDLNLILKKELYPITLKTWNKFCFLVDAAGGNSTIRFNELIQTVKNDFIVKEIRGGGQFYIGQDQDSLDGGFNEKQSLIAEMANFAFFDYLIDDDLATKFIHCEDIFSSAQPVLSFQNIQQDWKLNGSVVAGFQNTDAICKESTEYYLMFPEMVTFQKGKDQCTRTKGILPFNYDRKYDNLGSFLGQMIVPRDENHTEQFMPLAFEFKDICLNGYSTVSWLGIYFDPQSKVLYNINTNDTIENTYFIPRTDHCGVLTMLPDKVGSTIFNNCQFEACTLCQYDKTTEIKVYICSIFSIDYTI